MMLYSCEMRASIHKLILYNLLHVLAHLIPESLSILCTEQRLTKAHNTKFRARIVEAAPLACYWSKLLENE